jgi:hypothetical protein
MRTVHVLRKPVESTAAGSVQTYGTGALFIDGTRITCAPGDEVSLHGRKPVENGWDTRWSAGQTAGQKLGRWPTNLILGSLCDWDQVFPTTASGQHDNVREKDRVANGMFKGGIATEGNWYGDSGSAARFFKKVSSG